MDQKKILFADDDPEIREVLRLLLAGEGYRVIEASDGAQALELLDDTVAPVILDVMMPGMGGYAVCAEIRKRSAALAFALCSFAGSMLLGWAVLEWADAGQVFRQFWGEYAFSLENRGFAVHCEFEELKRTLRVNNEGRKRVFF